MATKYTFRENILRVIAVIGLIAVLLLGAWGIIQLAFFIPGFLSDLANGDNKTSTQESIAITVPTSVTSEQAFPITWTHRDGSGEYSYALSYSCEDGLSAKAPLPTGAGQVVPCNTAFNYINASTTSPLIFTLTGTKATPVTVKVTATKLSTGAATVSATAQTTVQPNKAPVKTPVKTSTATKPATTSKPTTTYVSSGQNRTNLYGLSDLRVQILKNPGSVRIGSQVSLQFSIENVGTNVTPQNWSFTASLPYNPAYTFQSQGQQALYPGDKIVYTLGYTAAPITQNYPQTGYPYDNYGWTNTAGVENWTYPYGTMGYDYQYQYNQYGYAQTSTASVSVDPYNLVQESNESNNYAAVSYQVY